MGPSPALMTWTAGPGGSTSVPKGTPRATASAQIVYGYTVPGNGGIYSNRTIVGVGGCELPGDRPDVLS